MAYLSCNQIAAMGFAFVADGARLSDKASYYNCPAISIGARTRIDDFCILAAGVGGIRIGCNVHIAAYCSLIGAAAITIEDFAGLSSRVSVYSSSDDYSGNTMSNPTVPERYTGVRSAAVYVGRHVIIGAGTVVLPGVVMEEGASIGALSLIRKRCSAFSFYMGAPAKRLGPRKNGLLALERLYRASLVPEGTTPAMPDPAAPAAV